MESDTQFFFNSRPADEDKLKEEIKIDLNEDALGWKKKIDVKKMEIVMQHLIFGS